LTSPIIPVGDLIYQVSSTDEQTIEFAKIALRNRLFVSQWALNGILHQAIKEPQKFEIAITIPPIAVAVLEQQTFLSVFVKKKYRQQGIASSLLKLLQVDRQTEVCLGISESRFLFEKFNLFIQDDHE
jgi:predicted GNAT family acetyltransferase